MIGSNRAKTKLEFFFLLRIIAQGIISLYFTLALFVIFEQDELEKEETSVLYAKTIIARSLELTLDSFVESKKKAAQDIYIYIFQEDEEEYLAPIEPSICKSRKSIEEEKG